MDAAPPTLATVPVVPPGPPALKADAWFTAGRQHPACEDAAAVRDDGRLVVVCDGCSSSPDTHLGAALLARGAQRGAPLTTVGAWADTLGLPIEALDATRLTAEADGAGVTVTIAGDGGFAVRGRDGALRWWRVVCPAGAPGYPAYALRPARLAAWRATFGDARVVCAETPDGPGDALDRPGFEPLTWRFDWADIDLVALFSDGLETFRRPTADETSRQLEPVPLADVLVPLLQVPAAHGHFLQRRARRVIDQATARGWRHLDDVSVAMIACPTAPGG